MNLHKILEKIKLNLIFNNSDVYCTVSGLKSIFISIVGLLCTLILLCTISGCISPDNPQSQVLSPISENFSITVTDTFGNSIKLPNPVKRIICQNGLSAEIIVAIGAGDRIVGVTDTALKEKYLMSRIPQAKSIGEIRNPDLERIISLHPDVFIAYGDSGSIPGNIDKIIAANITVLYVKIYDIRDIPNETRVLGTLTGHEKQAEQFIQFIGAYNSIIKDRVKNISQNERKRVYLEQIVDYMVTHRDSPGDYYINSIHAENIAGNITQPYAIVGPEWVIDQDPDIIIKQVTKGENISDVRNEIINRSGFFRTNAVKNNRVYALSSGMLSGPRQIVGMLYIAKAIYPERFEDLSPEDVLSDYATKFMPGSETTGFFDPVLGISNKIPVSQHQDYRS